MSRTDDAISHGFDAGNHANAYETTDYEHAIAKLSMNRSPEYVAAFTLGFFSSYERHEMGYDGADAYDAALALVGERAAALGYIDPPDDLNVCADCGADTSESGETHSCV